MSRHLVAIAAGLVMLAAALPALAQSGPNGGLVAGTGPHKTELVVTPTELTVYILEDGRLHDVKGTKLRAVIQQGAKSTSIDFAEIDGKRMVAKLPAPLEAGAIVVLSGKDDHGDRFNARYVIK